MRVDAESSEVGIKKKERRSTPFNSFIDVLSAKYDSSAQVLIHSGDSVDIDSALNSAAILICSIPGEIELASGIKHGINGLHNLSTSVEELDSNGLSCLSTHIQIGLGMERIGTH